MNNGLLCTLRLYHFQSYLFRGLPESFIRQASIRLKPEWIVATDYIVKQGEIDDKLYFIHRGIVAFAKHERRSSKDNEETNEAKKRLQKLSLSHGYISKSKYFGEVRFAFIDLMYYVLIPF